MVKKWADGFLSSGDMDEFLFQSLKKSKGFGCCGLMEE